MPDDKKIQDTEQGQVREKPAHADVTPDANNCEEPSYFLCCEIPQTRKGRLTCGICGIVSCVILIVVIVGVVWFLNRPDDIPLTTAVEDVDSPFEFVKAGSLLNLVDTTATTPLGMVTLSMSFRTGNVSVVSYWLDVALDDGALPATATASPLDFYFVPDVNDEDVLVNSTFVGLDSPLVFLVPAAVDNSNNNATSLPIRIDNGDTFDPDAFSGGVLVDTNTDVVVGIVTFTIVADRSTPLVLVAQLEGRNNYPQEGTILLSRRSQLVNKEVVVRQPYLIMQNIKATRAPGPFLYISEDSRWDDQDVFLPIDGVPEGSWSKQGSFVQDAPADLELERYVDGYFIVWCRPFRLTLGRGEISVQE